VRTIFIWEALCPEYLFSWLFPQIDAALHHGGAGTTGASLRGKSPSERILIAVVDVIVPAGIPTIIKPWFG